MLKYSKILSSEITFYLLIFYIRLHLYHCKNTFCGYALEWHHKGDSNEYQDHVEYRAKSFMLILLRWAKSCLEIVEK